MKPLIRNLLLTFPLLLGVLASPAPAQEEGAADAPAAAAEGGGGGSAFIGYAAAGFFTVASIFAICKSARRT